MCENVNAVSLMDDVFSVRLEKNLDNNSAAIYSLDMHNLLCLELSCVEAIPLISHDKPVVRLNANITIFITKALI